MDDLKAYRAKKEIIQAIKKRGYRVEPFQNLINIYMDMVKEQINIEEMLQQEELKEKSKIILQEIWDNLERDIEEYKQRFIT